MEYNKRNYYCRPGTNSITVSWPVPGTGSINVRETIDATGSAISTTPNYSVTLNPGAPAAAGPISGTTPVCQGQTGVVYSIAAVVNATNYVWTVPAGGTITAWCRNQNHYSELWCRRSKYDNSGLS